jgi:hypothetical protein
VYQINSLKHRLQRLIEADKVHLILTPDSISINKLGDGGVVMTDTFNGAQKLRDILVHRIDGAQDLDCKNHLCNVWIGGMEKSLSKYLKQMLCSSLDEIDSTLLVTTYISTVIHVIDRSSAYWQITRRITANSFWSGFANITPGFSSCSYMSNELLDPVKIFALRDILPST